MRCWRLLCGRRDREPKHPHKPAGLPVSPLRLSRMSASSRGPEWSPLPDLFPGESRKHRAELELPQGIMQLKTFRKFP